MTARGQAGGLSVHTRLVFYGLLLTTFMATMDQSIVATAGPTVVGQIGGVAHYPWVFTAYMLSFSVVMPVYGKLGDLIGRKRLFLFSIGVFLAGSALCGLAHTMAQLIAFRAVQGVGGGGLAVLAPAIIGELLEPRQRAKYQGYFTAVFALSALAGPLLGGAVTELAGWRWVFYINLPVGLVAVTLIARLLHVNRPTGPVRLDYAGATLLAGALISLTLLSSWGGTRYGFGSAPILALGALTVALLALWLVVEARVAEPVVPLRLFRDPTFVIANTVAFVANLAMFGVLNFLPLFLQMASGVSPSRSGALFLPAMLGMVAGALFAGQLIFRIGRYKWFPVASLGLGAIAMLLLAGMTVHTPVVVIMAYLVVLGIGIGLSQQTVVLAAQNTAPQRDLGVATATVTFARNAGVALGAGIFGAVLSGRLVAEVHRYLPGGSGADLVRGSLSPDRLRQLPPAQYAGYAEAYAHALSTVFLVAAPILLAGFLVALFLKDLPLQRRGPAAAKAATQTPAPAAGSSLAGTPAAGTPAASPEPAG